MTAYVFGLVLAIVAVLGAPWAGRPPSAYWRHVRLHVLAISSGFSSRAGRRSPPLFLRRLHRLRSVGLGLLFERVFKGGYALFAGSVLGFLTCLVATTWN